MLTAYSVFPAVVSVTGEIPGSNKLITGSGFFISPAGLIVTSKHIVDNPLVSYSITTVTGRRHPVTKIIKSGTSDLALLRTTARHTAWLTFASSKIVVADQSVVAISAGKGWQAAPGTVVNARHMVVAAGTTLIKSVTQRNVIPINAAVRPGYSGGPLINDNGQVIGVIFAYDANTGTVGFALPAIAVKELGRELLNQEYPRQLTLSW